MSHLQRLLPPCSEGEGGLRFFTANRQKKNSRHHDKRAISIWGLLPDHCRKLLFGAVSQEGEVESTGRRVERSEAHTGYLVYWYSDRVAGDHGIVTERSAALPQASRFGNRPASIGDS